MKLTDDEIDYILNNWSRRDTVKESAKGFTKGERIRRIFVDMGKDLGSPKLSPAHKEMYDAYIKLNLHEDMNTEMSETELTNYFKKLGIKEKDIEKILLNIKISRLGKPKTIPITLPPGAYDIKDIDQYIQSVLPTKPPIDISFSLKLDEITLKSIIETSNSIVFNFSLNELLGFTHKNVAHWNIHFR